jgi:hypothetical protein
MARKATPIRVVLDEKESTEPRHDARFAFAVGDLL